MYKLKIRQIQRKGDDMNTKKEVNRIEHALKRHSRIKPKKLSKRVNQLNRMLLKEPEWKKQEESAKGTNSSFLNSSNEKILYQIKKPYKKTNI